MFSFGGICRESIGIVRDPWMCGMGGIGGSAARPARAEPSLKLLFTKL